MSLERVLKALVGLGLSQTDAEVYVHLATTGSTTARSISVILHSTRARFITVLRHFKKKVLFIEIMNIR